MAVMFGQTCEFDARREDWTQYSERLSHYFAANGITDAARKKSILHVDSCGTCDLQAAAQSGVASEGG